MGYNKPIRSMKTVALVCALFLGASLNIGATQSVPMSAEERAMLDRLNARLRNNDNSALSEALAMRTELGAYFLEYYIQHGAPDVADKAATLMTRIPDHGQYFASRLKALSGRRDTDFERAELFDVLAKIGSSDAVRVAGPYLFDAKIVQPSAEDVTPMANAFLAVGALARMDLPGSPKGFKWAVSPEDYRHWQHWWRDNESRVDEIVGQRNDHSGTAVQPTEQPGVGKTEQTPTTASATLPKPIKPPDLTAKKLSFRVLIILLAVFGACVLISIVLLLKRR
jgi:hypothetical protein